MEVGYELFPAFWARGLSTEGARACLTFGFATAGLRQIISTTNPQNMASRRVMEKAGLIYRGERQHNGHETAWYSIDRADWLAQAGGKLR